MWGTKHTIILHNLERFGLNPQFMHPLVVMCTLAAGIDARLNFLY